MAISAEDKTAIANAVAYVFYQQAEATTPVPKQPDIGHVLAQTYNKAGDLQSRLSTLEATLDEIKALVETLVPTA